MAPGVVTQVAPEPVSQAQLLIVTVAVDSFLAVPAKVTPAPHSLMEFDSKPKLGRFPGSVDGWLSKMAVGPFSPQLTVHVTAPCVLRSPLWSSVHATPVL